MCKAILNCDVCTNANVCTKCSGSKYINVAVSPNTCVDSCPTDTHLERGKCYKGKYNYV